MDIRFLTKQQLYPTMLWAFEVKDELSMQTEAVLAKRAADPKGVNKSNLGGWHSKEDLHLDKNFQEMAQVIMKLSLELSKSLYVDLEKYRIGMSAMWANINAHGEANRQHAHFSNFLSGVFYLKLPSAVAALAFVDPRPVARAFHSSITHSFTTRADVNSADISVTPKVNHLYFFPSWFEHYVDPSTAEGDRISVSFNLFLEKIRAH